MEQSSLETVILAFFSDREGVSSLNEIRDVDLMDEGLLDSLDIVELASLLGMARGNPVDLSKKEDFDAMRTVRTILERFG